MTPQTETDLEQLLILLSELRSSKDDSSSGMSRALLEEFVSTRFCPLEEEVALAQ